MMQLVLLPYRFFSRHKLLMYCILAGLIGILAFFASKIRFEEDISSFIPQTKDGGYVSEVFRQTKVKDKIILLFTSEDENNADQLAETADIFIDSLQKSDVGKSHINSILSQTGADISDKAYTYVTEKLPFFLKQADYERIDSLLVYQNLEKRMEQNYRNLISPLSTVTKKYIFSDPLGLTGNALAHFADLQLSANYEIHDEHIFSTDLKTLIAIVSPVFPAGDISHNKMLVNALDKQISAFSATYPETKISYFGGIPVAVENARQIRNDSLISLFIAVILIGALVLLAFKRKSAVLLIFLPVAFGGLSALAAMSILQTTVSTIAVGAGSIILGVALSYSIHVFCHSLHSSSAEDVIRELAMPLTVGSFTTIGGFAGLAFCKSPVLHDLGLFACFALIGTTVFCLFFMPHFLKFGIQKENRTMRTIEKITSYPYEKNKILLIAITLVFTVCLIFSGKVEFDSDMNRLTYMSDSMQKTEKFTESVFESEFRNIYFISADKDENAVFKKYSAMNEKLEKLRSDGLIAQVSSAKHLLVSPEIQRIKIAEWNNFWTTDKKAKLLNDLLQIGKNYNFKPEAFADFEALLSRNFKPLDYQSKTFTDNDLLNDKLDFSGKIKMLVSQISLKESDKDAVYSQFADTDIVILDKPYFASRMAGALNSDFNTVLYIVSILVFLALLISYGRIELALLTFLPMAAAWVIILGLMYLCGIEFNIVNIIISTFIFGIGDDFAIFITDGLMQEYRTGKKLLEAHKTAVFFSAYTVIIGLGAMIFSRHPALHSVAASAMIGMFAVIIVSFTVQPYVFKLFISGRTERGLYPFTWNRLFMSGKGDSNLRRRLMMNYVYKGPVLEWYARIKTSMESDYQPFEQWIPADAAITDLGCGYGFLDYMLAFRSQNRIITGIDYDEDKVATAEHNFSRSKNLKFFCKDVSTAEFESSDVFILNDVLHYLPKEKQAAVLQKCVEKLNKNGQIIIRDGDSSKQEKHRLTRISELFSTRLLGFNKRENDLCFLSSEEISHFAAANNLSLTAVENDKYSSNTIFILKG